MSSPRKPLSDTDPVSALVRDQVLQDLPPQRKVQLVEDANRTGRMLALAGIEARHPELEPEERVRLLMDLVLGEDTAREVYGPPGRLNCLMTPENPEALQVAFLVFDVLDSLGRRYHLGGSYASSIHGIPRQTHDVDIVCELHLGDEDHMAPKLEADFYYDRDRMRQAISARSSFNLVHLTTGVKVDVFPKGETSFDTQELERSLNIKLGEPPRMVPVKSAEDTILRKLEWYRKGGEVSDRQWTDVLGIVRTQRGRLDLDYLRPQSTTLGIDDLLARALEAAAPG